MCVALQLCVGGRGRKGCSPGYSNGQRRLLRRDKTDEALGRHRGLWSFTDKNTPLPLVRQCAHTHEGRVEMEWKQRQDTKWLKLFSECSAILHAFVSLGVLKWLNCVHRDLPHPPPLLSPPTAPHIALGPHLRPPFLGVPSALCQGPGESYTL